MAANTPSGRPTINANRIDTVESSTVAGRNCETSVLIGRRVLIDVPRSPCARLPRNARYCSYRGLSRPHLALKAATISGRCDACWPRLDTTGSAGTAWEMTEEINVTTD